MRSKLLMFDVEMMSYESGYSNDELRNETPTVRTSNCLYGLHHSMDGTGQQAKQIHSLIRFNRDFTTRTEGKAHDAGRRARRRNQITVS